MFRFIIFFVKEIIIPECNLKESSSVSVRKKPCFSLANQKKGPFII